MKKDEEKLAFIFKYLDGMYYFKDEDVNDHSKRVILRYFFILTDDLLKLARKVKNGLSKEGKLSKESKAKIESAVKTLEETYNNNYDTIRDKLSAHQQPLSLIDLHDWWSEIDYTTIESIYSEIHEIREHFKSSGNDFFTPLTQYSKLDIFVPKLLPKDETQYFMSSDRLGALKGNTVSMTPLHNSQEKAQIILSILDLLENNFALTLQSEPCRTDYETLLFDIGWLLSIWGASQGRILIIHY